ncbi:MAG: methyltransferase domain-containing protein [Candidatus Nomurabacteria bacterium]|nr:MAG: methyltransferase domain-containing protein [Candidatus Nomurabacteria bacterium]
MPQYYFILGKNPKLSLAELDQALQTRAITSEVVARASDYCILETKEELNLVELLQHLGGTLKAGQILEGLSSRDEVQSICANVDWAEKKLPLTKHRAEFGISVYGTKKSGPLSKRYGLGLKKALQSIGHSVRMIFDPSGQLSSVTVAKNGLLSKGFELCVLESATQHWLGLSQAVQSFRKFSERDYGRPDRDARNGMLPPKLALMMLNIAGAKSGSVVLDPFCGSGTVLQEALLLGCKKVYGSDISEKAVKDSQNNVQWLSTQEKSIGTVQIRKVDARQLRPTYVAESVDVIVTEPDLGPPRPARNEEQIEERRQEAIALYRSFLSSATKVLKANGRVVMAWPVWSLQDTRYHLHPKKILPDGWTLLWPYGDLVSQDGEKTLLYERPGQFVAREIVILSPNK